MQKSFKNDQKNHKDRKQPKKKANILIQIPRFPTPQNGIFLFLERCFVILKILKEIMEISPKK
jgi:hypothetical protein